MPTRTLVIANPSSRKRSTSRRMKALEAKLRSALGPLDVECTRGPRDAERIAREGGRSGIDRVFAIGGDGTVCEVVTGLLSAKLGDYAEIGLIPFGTANDFANGLGLTRDVDDAIERLVVGKTFRADVGRVSFRVDDEREGVTYFANVASFGLSGIVGDLVNRASKMLGGRISYALGALRGIARHRNDSASILIDGASVFEGPLVLVAVANGPYFGGGMKIAPDARIDDGVFDWVIVPGMSRFALLAKLSHLYRGSHLRDARILHGRGRVIEVRGSVEAAPLDVDGESVGALSARFEILPEAITLVGCSP
jgi:diacylglycerol kinase (ATP)